MAVPRALTRARQSLSRLTLSETATIQRKTRVADSAGGSVETWANQATYPCSYEAYPISPVERENTTRVQALSYWKFVFPFDADVRSADRIVVNGRTFEAIGQTTGSVSISLRLTALEIT